MKPERLEEARMMISCDVSGSSLTKAQLGGGQRQPPADDSELQHRNVT